MPTQFDEQFEENPDLEPEADELAEEQSQSPRSGKTRLHRNTISSFAIFGLLIGATWFMTWRSGPSKASASATDADGQAITNFLGTGRGNLRSLKTMIAHTAEMVAGFSQYPSANQVPLDDLKTNPFHLSQITASHADPDEAAARQAKEARLQSVLAAARTLHLQSVLIGSGRQSCIIDGKIFYEGQSVGPFTLKEVRPRSVILATDEFKLEIPMRTPSKN